MKNFRDEVNAIMSVLADAVLEKQVNEYARVFAEWRKDDMGDEK